MTERFLDMFGSAAVVDWGAVFGLLLRLAVDLVAVMLVVRWVYVRYHGWNRMVFTYFAFNVVTFALCLMLSNVPIELGFALGLFAVFGVLRYRTESIRIHDLTYLFLVIGIALLNGMTHEHVSVVEVLLVNGVIVGAAWVLEVRYAARGIESIRVRYDKLDLLKPGMERELLEDLRTKTGLAVEGVEVLTVDLKRKSAGIIVSYPTAAGTRVRVAGSGSEEG